ncbi:glutathione S-transferase, partial [Tremellales sp. Uapishka_1]
MRFQVHGTVMSTCTRRVLASLEEMGLVSGKDYGLVEQDYSKIKSPEYLKHQPFGQIPYLVDTETNVEMYESKAIARYVASQVKSPLQPSIDDPKAYAAYETAVSVEAFHFDQHCYEIIKEKSRNPFGDKNVSKKIMAYHSQKLAEVLQGYETILGRQQFLAGNRLTLVDIFHVQYGQWMVSAGTAPSLDDGSLPNVARWWKATNESKGPAMAEGLRADWVKAHPDIYANMRKMYEPEE